MVKEELFQHAMQHQMKGGFIMDNLQEVMEINETNAIPDNEIDLSEIPEINSLEGFKPIHPEYYKPVREQVSIRFNKVLVEHFKTFGKGWQTKVNNFLMQEYINGRI